MDNREPETVRMFLRQSNVLSSSGGRNVLADKKKICLFYLNTGGGHLAPARAIARFLERESSERIHPVLIDGLAKAPRWIRSVVEDGYRLLQARGRNLYALYYLLNKLRPIAKLNRSVVSRFALQYVEERILADLPERIVVFHFLLIKPVMDVLQKHALNIPVVVVVTDPYTAHPIWFLDNRQQFIVFSRQVKKRAISAGVPAGNINILPFPVDEKFSVPFAREEVERTKVSFGLYPHRKTILLLGGADGIPNGDVLVRNLSQANSEANIVIICGRNTSLQNRIEAWVQEQHVPQVKVFGYVNCIYEMLNIADVVVTKCGASTLMEVLLSRNIPVVNSYLWEQEKGNIDFIRAKNIGMYEPNPLRLSQLVRSLLDNKSLRSAMQRNIEELNLINGAETVARFIYHDITKSAFCPDLR